MIWALNQEATWRSACLVLWVSTSMNPKICSLSSLGSDISDIAISVGAVSAGRGIYRAPDNVAQSAYMSIVLNAVISSLDRGR